MHITDNSRWVVSVRVWVHFFHCIFRARNPEPYFEQQYDVPVFFKGHIMLPFNLFAVAIQAQQNHMGHPTLNTTRIRKVTAPLCCFLFQKRLFPASVFVSVFVFVSVNHSCNPAQVACNPAPPHGFPVPAWPALLPLLSHSPI